MKTVIFFDTEYTTWEGAMAANWSLPGQYQEITQIAALRFDLDTMQAVDEFSILTKPVKNPRLSDFFIELTGLTQSMMDRDGVSFKDGFKRFVDFCGADTAASYGADDAILRRNQEWAGMAADFHAQNIRNWFQTHGAAYGVHQRTNSGALAATLGAPIDVIQEHNALHDVRSIAAAYRFLTERGAPDFFAALMAKPA